MLSKLGIEDFSITHAAKLDYAAIVAYVAEGQAELYEFPVGGLHPEVLKFMPMAFQPELKRELRQFACHTRRRLREGDRWWFSPMSLLGDQETCPAVARNGR